MSNLADDIDALFSDLVSELSDPSLTGSERNTVLQAAAAIKDQAFKNALKAFRIGTAKFNEVTTKLTAAAAEIASPSVRKKIQKIVAQLGDLHAAFHEPEQEVEPANNSDKPKPANPDDENETEPNPEQDPAISASGSIDGPVISSPAPKNSTSFSDLKDEYVDFFLGARFRSENAKEETHRLCRAAAEDKHRYSEVSQIVGAPWWFIAAIHLLESGRNFSRHLHNGDKLTARTKRVPANRPATGNPPFTWEESAIDALKLKKFHKRTDWSLARSLYRLEQYNGFGYRTRNIPTPYLWSLTTLYKKGKFASDGVFDPNLVSKQCGAAAFLRGLVEIGEVEAKEIVGLDVGAGEVVESQDAVINPIPAEPADPPVVDHAFKLFFEKNLPGVKNFRWDEFLVKGASHHRTTSKAHGLNTDPPAELWPNVIPLANALQKLREEIGAPVKLTSVYRSPEYNEQIDGASANSYHMSFIAADIIAASGSPREWRDKAIKLRRAGVFTGGIGLYKTFIHIDVRGSVANWKGKGVP